MKKISIIYAIGAMTLFGACDSFLDTTPDNRAELDSYEKVRQILVDAYPGAYGTMAMEWSSDNVYDNGPEYKNGFEDIEHAYRWEPMITSGNGDSPNGIWNGCYGAVASANHALAAIESMGGGKEFNPLKAEALLCRAFGHFTLSETFCLPYNKETADKDLGLPYVLKPETEVAPKYERKNMKELYERINADIEEALPLVDDNVYKVPKYHFNKKAAYAFAARFNLYYGNYQKAIEYASVVFGSKPAGLMRDWAAWLETPKTFDDMWNAYMNASLPTNFFITVPLQTVARYLRSGNYARYAHSKLIANVETLRVPDLFWGDYGNLVKAKYGGSSNDQLLCFVSVPEKFEYTDKAASIGYVHTALMPFTGGKLILERAEAYALKGELDNAVADINLWLASATLNKVQVTKEQIVTFFKSVNYTAYPLKKNGERTIKKVLHPQGFTVDAEGDQEMIVHCILHLKRIEFIHEGGRFMDIKRYGIEISHNLNGRDDQYINLPVNDPRRAIQLPQDVIAAGLTPNPTK
ncbi:MAG: RagB/SusD family nutrient uptake outer membrane protein [Bacteroidia bacterium]|nr:RagB/SusD family nutrient uptake outer membrane protein [Bacteroidia bacterium]